MKRVLLFGVIRDAMRYPLTGGALLIAVLGLAACAGKPVPASAVTAQTPELEDESRRVDPPALATSLPSPTAIPTPSPMPTSLPTATLASDPNGGIAFTERGDPSRSQVAITIDDFLDTEVITYWLIEYLEENPDVKVTMFPIGSRVAAIEALYPGLWQRWLDAGHEIGFHSLHHDRLDLMTPEQLAAELTEFNRIVGEAVGDPTFRVRWARSTFGEYGGSRDMFAEAAEDFGVTWVLWSINPSHVNYIGHIYGMQHSKAVQNGDIALFHIRWQDQYWIERYVEECRRRGIAMVTLSQMQLIADE